MFHVDGLDAVRAQELRSALTRLAGVVEAAVLADEGVAMLKVKLSGWDEATAIRLLQGEA
jgi:hypothetical protein